MVAAGALDALKIDTCLLERFVRHVDAQHDDRVPYHNMCHVYNVVQMLCVFLGWPEVRAKLEPLEVAAVLIAGKRTSRCKRPGLTDTFRYSVEN